MDSKDFNQGHSNARLEHLERLLNEMREDLKKSSKETSESLHSLEKALLQLGLSAESIGEFKAEARKKYSDLDDRLSRLEDEYHNRHGVKNFFTLFAKQLPLWSAIFVAALFLSFLFLEKNNISIQSIRETQAVESQGKNNL